MLYRIVIPIRAAPPTPPTTPPTIAPVLFSEVVFTPFFKKK
jgi:hypothetical protein